MDGEHPEASVYPFQEQIEGRFEFESLILLSVEAHLPLN